MRPLILFAVVAILLLLSLASGVWASPGQSGLRQTVPTRTPTKMPTNTPEQPTPEPPTATPVPPTPVPPTPVLPTAQPSQPTSAPSGDQATAVPTPTMPEPTTVVTTEFPKTGGDFTPWIRAGAALVLIAGLAYVAWRNHRAIARR